MRRRGGHSSHSSTTDDHSLKRAGRDDAGRLAPTRIGGPGTGRELLARGRVDGCAAPNFAMPLTAMARCFANLINSPDSFSDDVKRACSRIVSAMTYYPELIGGRERLDTMVMQAAPGTVISKVGAEGVWLCGVLPSEKYPTGLAIALKVEDGDDKRARPVVAVELLRRLGLLRHNDLPDASPMQLRNRRGDVVGRVEGNFIL